MTPLEGILLVLTASSWITTLVVWYICQDALKILQHIFDASETIEEEE